MKKILKKVVILGLFLVLIGGALIFVCVITSPTTSQREFYEPAISLDEAKGLSDEEIAVKLFGMYLEHYTSQSLPEMERLKDYKVLNVNKIQAVDGIFYAIGYSVQTYSPPFNYCWGPGNGINEQDNWIVRKSNYIRLIKEEGQYRMEMHGTGL